MDTTEFQKMVNLYQNSIMGILYRMLHSQEDIRDIMQEALIRTGFFHQFYKKPRSIK